MLDVIGKDHAAQMKSVVVVTKTSAVLVRACTKSLVEQSIYMHALYDHMTPGHTPAHQLITWQQVAVQYSLVDHFE